MSRKADLGCWQEKSSEEKYPEPTVREQRGRGAQQQSYNLTLTDAGLSAQIGTSALVAENLRDT